jgi:hypothetical protein
LGFCPHHTLTHQIPSSVRSRFLRNNREPSRNGTGTNSTHSRERERSRSGDPFAHGWLATSARQQELAGYGRWWRSWLALEPSFSEKLVWCAQQPQLYHPLARVSGWCRQEIACRCRSAIFGRYGTVLRYWPLAGTDAAVPMAARRGSSSAARPPVPRLFFQDSKS